MHNHSTLVEHEIEAVVAVSLKLAVGADEGHAVADGLSYYEAIVRVSVVIKHRKTRQPL